MKILVPGNLLLFGEYAVAYPGGLGIAVATKEHLAVNISAANTLTVSGIYGNKRYQWTAGKPYPSPLIAHIIESLNQFPAIHIHLDSSQLYYPDGVKKGFGSSAAAAIGLTYALMRDQMKSAEELMKLSLELHRSFQGGKGSGYDIAASCIGGAGLFQSASPFSWKPLDTSLYQSLYLIRGSATCKTGSTLEKLERFKEKSPSRFDQFIEVSNKLAVRFTQSISGFYQASLLNRWINRQLAHEVSWEDDSAIKPLGAGAEIGAATGPRPGAERLRISDRGIQCLT